MHIATKDGTQIYYKDWGQGQPIVFSHGWPLSGDDWDTAHNLTGGFFDARGIKIPVAVSAFAEEIYQAPKSWAEKAYPKLIHYNSFPKGTHFAAWEQTDLFVSEMRASFKSLRG